MSSIQYYMPADLVEASRILQAVEHSHVIAGGTDLVPKMKTGVLKPRALVDLSKIKDLSAIVSTPEGLYIGAMANVADLADRQSPANSYAVLRLAARSLGSPQVRNLATIGGNLCNAAPSADLATALLALDAQVEISGATGVKTVPLDQFFKGPGYTVLQRGEILTRVFVPSYMKVWKSFYLKHTIRRSMDIAVVAVAASVLWDEKSREVKDVRIALGAVAPTPLRARSTEKAIRGKILNEATITAAASEAMNECRPISDVRGTATYRRILTKVLTTRALRILAEC
ncbi:MAG TPA: xanthine dehydrogenase family protein subunit M [Clostridia bacterium]|nr:xanthine dehydrogenase family protein subunit M [Clostridia bacterium]